MSNIIKNACNELRLTYKEFGELIGYGEGAIKSAISKNKVSSPMKKAVELYFEKLELESKVKKSEEFKAILKEFLES